MDTLEKIEEYLESVEEYLYSSLSAVTNGLPDVHEVANRLWIDISRYGPGLPAFPEVRIPSLGDFQVPPPPPPPPMPPPTLLERSTDWVGKHPWKATGVVATAVGAGLLVGYGVTRTRRRGLQRLRAQQVGSVERRQVVVVLGGDSPFGLPLILDLEKKGYIVIASVASPEAAEVLEQQTRGYVKALVLDPYEPLMIPAFLRSLTATLSRKFPINAPGDPYAPLSSHPYVHSVISLLTLPRNLSHTLAPLEHVSLPETYLPYLTATHITPLQVVQALLPLLRTGPALGRDKGKKSIVICLPATDTRIGLPFSSIRSMSAASTLRGVEVLRREIKAAALTGKAESMKNIRVVVVDVGMFDVGIANEAVPVAGSVYKSMENWTASEKLTYGPAFASIVHDATPRSRSYWTTFASGFGSTHRYGVPRQPTNVSVFVDNVIGVVNGGRTGYSILGIGLGLGRIRNFIRGERFSVGAGSYTYKMASHLPATFLDILLNIPHILIGIRNRLLMIEPYMLPPASPPTQRKTGAEDAHPVTSPQSRNEEYNETSSEHDSESVSGESGVDSSWVSLNGSQSELASGGASN